MVTIMNKPKPSTSGERIIETMIELARCSKPHRIIVAGPNGPQQMFELHRRGYNRVATTTTCGLPCGQYHAAFVEWQLRSIKPLEATLDWLAHFLAPKSVVVIWIATRECQDHQKLGSVLERLGFRVEAGTRCERGLAVSARRLEANQQVIAA
jgi:hypothetical protein